MIFTIHKFILHSKGVMGCNKTTLIINYTHLSMLPILCLAFIKCNCIARLIYVFEYEWNPANVNI